MQHDVGAHVPFAPAEPVAGRLTDSPTAGTTTRSSGRGGVGRGRRADARGRGHAGHHRRLLLGDAGDGAGRSTTSAGWTGSSTCCTRPASRSAWRRRPPRRRRGSRTPTRSSLPVTVEWRTPGHRLARGVLPELAGLPRRPSQRSPGAAGRALRGASGARALARQQRVRRPRPGVLLRRPARRRSAHWLRDAVRDLDALNDAWGTAFWSQRYTAVGGDRRRRAPPRCRSTRRSGWTSRGSRSDEHLACFRGERDIRAVVADGSRSPPTSWPPNCPTWTTGAGPGRSTSSPTTTT